jgi:nicotinate-nucleotide adenylyltransferase
MAVTFGILGGSFDPIHLGHIAIAKYAFEKLHLNKIIFVPAGDPWMKTNGLVAGTKDRLDMVEAAIAGDDSFEVSHVEIGIDGPSYTINTIKKLRKMAPESDELIFILGQDSVLGIDLWKKVSELVKLCKFAVVPRDGVNDVNAAFLDKKVAGLGEKAVFLEGMPRINISSTNIRERIAARQSIEAMVPQKVFEIIEERNLYGS